MGNDVVDDGLIEGEDGKLRCWWHGNDPFYRDYHDREWGRPVVDDRRLFEKICLEGFQSGLSWLTILRKRENFRAAFHDFDFRIIQGMDDADTDRLMQDKGIVRHRGKIRAVIGNAARAVDLVEEAGSLAAYFWSNEPRADERPARIDRKTMAVLGWTERSKAISKDLKKRGWSFVGPTTVYAFMQAMGLVNDHLVGCCIREEIEEARAALVRPC